MIETREQAWAQLNQALHIQLTQPRKDWPENLAEVEAEANQFLDANPPAGSLEPVQLTLSPKSMGQIGEMIEGIVSPVQGALDKMSGAVDLLHRIADSQDLWIGILDFDTVIQKDGTEVELTKAERGYLRTILGDILTYAGREDYLTEALGPGPAIPPMPAPPTSRPPEGYALSEVTEGPIYHQAEPQVLAQHPPGVTVAVAQPQPVQQPVESMSPMAKARARRQDETHGQLVVRTAEPTLDMGHLQRLLAENLARITLHAPALYLHLRSLETAALPGATASLLPDEVRAGDSLHHLLERLSARLGAGHVLRAVPHADHRPERMQVWQPASGVAASALLAKPDALYPTWLLTPPLKLPVHNNLPHCADDGNPLTLLAGPQRLEAGWWIGQKGLDAVVNQGGSQGGDAPPAASASPCALRDYFLARSAQMGLLWVYQERLGGQGSAQRTAAGADWYLHGLFA